MVDEPGHAQGVELLVKELHPLQHSEQITTSPSTGSNRLPVSGAEAWVPWGCLTHQLPRQQGHVLDDGQADPPLGVLGQLHDGGQQGLGQLADADHLVDAVQVGDDVQAHLRALDKDTHRGMRWETHTVLP